jgi:hypothetical protein
VAQNRAAIDPAPGLTTNCQTAIPTAAATTAAPITIRTTIRGERPDAVACRMVVVVAERTVVEDGTTVVVLR